MSEAFVLYACNNYGFNKKLVNATVEQFGGSDKFKEYAPTISSDTSREAVEGLSTFEETKQFYQENRKAIKAWLMGSHGEFEYDCSIPEYVSKMTLVEKQNFSVTEIEWFLAVDNKEQDGYTNFATAMCLQVVHDLCGAYNRWASNEASV